MPVRMAFMASPFRTCAFTASSFIVGKPVATFTLSIIIASFAAERKPVRTSTITLVALVIMVSLLLVFLVFCSSLIPLISCHQRIMAFLLIEILYHHPLFCFE